MNQRQTILIVDDDENDLLLLRVAFENAGCQNPLQQVHNGAEAIAYLQGGGLYADRKTFPLPAVLLLDLNMPRKNGFDVLAWVRAQPGLKRLAIVIMTASMRGQDLERAFDLGATSFLVKPGTLDSLTVMTRRLCDWIAINQFPPLHESEKK